MFKMSIHVFCQDFEKSKILKLLKQKVLNQMVKPKYQELKKV